MAGITAADVKALRELTDLPMMDCKKALVEADGDQEKAIAILKEKAGKIMLKRADNPTSEGKIVTLLAEDGSKGVMVEVQCESAPVASSESFNEFANQCAKQLLTGPGAETPEELFEQSAPDHAGKTLRDLYEAMVNQIREKIVLARIACMEGPLGAYVHHDGKQGVLFQAAGEGGSAEVLRDVAMHITAMRPTAVNPEDLDPAAAQEERARLVEEAKSTGKPDNIIDKIVDGRMKLYYVEAGVLNLQAFAKDEAKTVSQALAEQGFKAVAFTRWVIGG